MEKKEVVYLNQQTTSVLLELMKKYPKPKETPKEDKTA